MKMLRHTASVVGELKQVETVCAPTLYKTLNAGLD